MYKEMFYQSSESLHLKGLGRSDNFKHYCGGNE